MKRVLFVDDERALLDGLRGRLRRLRSRWEMVFVESGPRAITEMELAPADVIVADMRMPKMDGVELLGIVRECWPKTLRVVLSGHTQQEQSARVLALAHQYLSKPCEPDQLESTIERLLEAEQILARPDLRAIVTGIGGLPTDPAQHRRLCTELCAGDISMEHAVCLVAQSSPVTARLLQVANSAFFRLPRALTSIAQALSHLGIQSVRALVSSQDVFTGWSEGASSVPGLAPDQLQRRAIQVSSAARALATGTAHADAAALAGLLHNIGYWVLLERCPERMRDVVRLAVTAGVPLHRAERKVLGASHAEVGAYLLSLWGLPASIVEAVGCQHVPQRLEQDAFGVSGILVTAASLSAACGVGAVLFGRDFPISDEYLRSLRAPFDLAEARRRVGECIEGVCS